MYNPMRQNATVPKRRPTANHNSIKKHSNILKKADNSLSIPNEERTRTDFGFTSPIFDCSKFSVKYEVLGAKSSVGYGYTNHGDRTIRVLSGTLYVSLDDNGVRKTLPIGPGCHVHAKSGVKHGYATSQSPAELLVVETKNYNKKWVAIEDVVVGEIIPEMIEKDIISRSGASKAVQQAKEMANSRRSRQERSMAAAEVARSRGNANSANSIGPNPMPVLPPLDE